METKNIEMRINEMCKMAERAYSSNLLIDVSAWSDELKERFNLCPEDETIIDIDTFDVLSGREKDGGKVSGKQELGMIASELLDAVDRQGRWNDEPDMFGLLAGCPIVLETWELVRNDDGDELFKVGKEKIGTFSYYLSKIWSHGASEEGVFHDMVALGVA